jgi:hypothetical protein
VEAVRVESAEELERALSDKFAPCEYAGTLPSFRPGQVVGQDLGGGIRLVNIGLQVGSKGELDMGLLMTKRGTIIGTTLRVPWSRRHGSSRP